MAAAFSIWLLGFAGLPAEAAATKEIKVALITPEGSTWTNALYKLARVVEQQTGGEVVFRVYAGGVSGDELDVLRKMRANRIQAAGFSGVGLGVILPEIRVLEAPLLFRSYAEVDRVKSRLFDRFAAGFAENGFVLLGFAEAGFVYFFARPPMTGSDGLDPLKMWAWKGDPVARSTLEAFGIKTFPLHLADVNTGLETGMINSFYSPPLAAIAFQWYAKIRYMLDFPIVNSTGAFLIRKSTFDGLSEDHQKILREQSRRFCDELVRLSRKENEEAMNVLKASGIVFETPAGRQVQSFEESARKVHAENMNKLYSRRLFEQVQQILRQYRGR
jgi:TRAP-type C4-dicarboxylate transport system substrate-binding protein